MRIKKIRQSLGAIGNVADSYTTDSNACYNAPYINSLQATILWTNSSPSSEFTGQSITLSDSIANYKYYEIIYRQSTGTERVASTGRLPVPSLTEIRSNSTTNQRRPVTALSGTTMTFGAASYYATYGSGTDTYSNVYIIPYQILGYK